MENALPAVIEAEATEITTGRERIGDRQLVEMWAARSSSPNTRRNYLRQAARLLDFLGGRGLDLNMAHVGDIQDYLAGIEGAPATRVNALPRSSRSSRSSRSLKRRDISASMSGRW